MSKKSGRSQSAAKPQAQPQRNHQNTNHIAIASQAWQGPLPSPNDLERFDGVVPGLAERIVKMAESEGTHSRRVQLIAVTTASIAQVLGQVFALTVALAGLWAAYRLAMADHESVAIVVGGATITTIVAAFLQARRAQKSQ